MNAELKEIYSPDIEDPLEGFVPRQWDNFELTLRVMFGPAGDEASDSFQIQVCTPKWLQARCEGGEIISGRHRLIVGEFDFIKIRKYLEALCRRCSGNDWNEIAQKLSRYGYWEFEDYRPFT
jgi:hypothetical protein